MLVSVAIAGDAQSRVQEKEDELTHIENRIDILEAKLTALDAIEDSRLTQLKGLCQLVSSTNILVLSRVQLFRVRVNFEFQKVEYERVRVFWAQISIEFK